MPLDIGTLLLILGFSYGIGLFWYRLLPGQFSYKIWRVVAYPFVAIVIAEALWPMGPEFGGLHIYPAIIAAAFGVVVDWLVTMLRHPRAVELMEPAPTRA